MEGRLAATREAMQADVPPIFEATFEANGVWQKDDHGSRRLSRGSSAPPPASIPLRASRARSRYSRPRELHSLVGRAEFPW